VYSVHAYAGGTIQEKDWTIGSGNHRYGLSQYSNWKDVHGFTIMDIERQGTRYGVHQRYTIVNLGARSFAVPMGIWTVAALGLSVITSIMWLLFFLMRKMGKSPRSPVTVSTANS
jgi:hypothetical protein